MKELFINKARSCSVTGHRIMEKAFDKKRLKDIFLSLYDIGYRTFLVGMALGFDTVCFQVLEEIRKERDIEIIACVPCLTQSYKFTVSQKKEYDRMLSVSDQTVLISEAYDENCMQKRNEYMVDNSSVIVTYIRRDFGGTFNTVKYAEKKGIQIINV